jgi:uncharacterized protein involved in exopolysaccharide biosynthesis
MRTQRPWSSGQGGYEAAARPAAVVRQRYGLGDIVAMLWAESFLMLTVFIVLLALGVAFAFTLEKTYTAYSSVLVRMGQEYIYNPRVGEAGRGATLKTEEVVQAEVEILQSAQLKQRVMDDVGVKVIAPKLGAAYEAGDPTVRKTIEGTVIRTMESSLKIATAPQTAVVRLSYDHPNPESAAAILNSIVDNYLEYREQVLLDPSSPAIEAQRRLFEQRLEDADQAYEGFLAQNGIGDFTAEKTSLAALYQSVLDERFKVDARLREVQGRLGQLSAGVGGVPGEIELQRDVDMSATEKLVDLKIEREDLLARYLPDSRPVQENAVKIAQLERLIASGQGSGVLAQRLGPNPVRQAVETDLRTAQAEAAALEQRRAELERQVGEVTSRLQRLTALEGEYQVLATNRDVLQSNVKTFAARGEESRAARAIAEASDETVRVIQRAVPPSKGHSLRKPVLAAALLFAAFTALCLGLLRVFLRRGFGTPGTAARTLDLPVLAVAPVKR